jgi:hypothetical protein
MNKVPPKHVAFIPHTTADLRGAWRNHTKSAALKGTELVALWLAPAAFTLEETLPPYPFTIGHARRAITPICLTIMRNGNRNETSGNAPLFGQGWELDHVDRPNAPAKPASALEPR